MYICIYLKNPIDESWDELDGRLEKCVQNSFRNIVEIKRKNATVISGRHICTKIQDTLRTVLGKIFDIQILFDARILDIM